MSDQPHEVAAPPSRALAAAAAFAADMADRILDLGGRPEVTWAHLADVEAKGCVYPDIRMRIWLGADQGLSLEDTVKVVLHECGHLKQFQLNRQHPGSFVESELEAGAEAFAIKHARALLHAGLAAGWKYERVDIGRKGSRYGFHVGTEFFPEGPGENPRGDHRVITTRPHRVYRQEPRFA